MVPPTHRVGLAGLCNPVSPTPVNGATGCEPGIGGVMADFDEGDIIRIGARMVYDTSEDVVNVYHLRMNGGAPMTFAQIVPDLQDYMDGIMAEVDTELVTRMAAADLSISNVTQATVFGAIAWGDFAQGGDAGAPTPAGVACFGFIRTRKPRVQIRKYYGVFPQAALQVGSWDAGVTDAVGDALAWLMAEQVGAAGSELQGVAYNREFGTYEYGHTIQVNSEPNYQRRRRRGVGS